MKKLFLTAFAALCSLTVFYSCAENDNPVVVNNDSKATIYTENADNSVRPGDDFYTHCVGSWVERTTYSIPKIGFESYLFVQMAGKWEKTAEAAVVSNMKQVEAHSVNFGNKDQADLDTVKGVLARIKAAQSREELWELMGALCKEGYQMPFSLVSLAKEGKMQIAILPAKKLDIQSAIDKKTEDKDGAEDEEKGWSDGDWKDWDGSDYNYDYWEQLLRSGRLAEMVEPIVGEGGTRGFASEKWPMLVSVCKGLGVDPVSVYVATEEFLETTKDEFDVPSSEGLEILQTYEADELAAAITDYIDDSRLVCDPDLLQKAQEKSGQVLSGEDVVSALYEYMKYPLSHAVAKGFCTPDMRTTGQRYVDELKQAFNERIATNDWLSEASKQSAIEKMNAMAVNIAYPDWIEEGLPDFSQTKTLFQDMIEIRKAYCRLAMKLVGMPVDQGAFHAATAYFVPLTVFNAYYAPCFNSMNIMPCWFMDELALQNRDASEAEKYALMMVFGHEMTHGFDVIGAQWDKVGDLKSIWASEADAKEFERRAQLLSDYYSTQEIMPGTFANGKKTLAENIADLGGTELAFQAFTTKLKAQGIGGEELRQQQRNFFVALANLWRAKYNEYHIKESLSGDVHSLEKERVNCVVANIDAWYDLFDVKPGDKLYRSPAERVHIW